ncbi:MAG: hypothetical protein B7Z80_04630 [Rhodospirillales bacterium 20-64-7]|nr:MAG: hypothetical protein B7Z80_04630 [Rhodospirillales bacterium 20-64-7]
MAQTLGIVNLIWGGQKFAVANGATFKPGGLVAKRVVHGNKVDYANEGTASEISASFPLPNGMSIVGLKALSGSEAQFQCDSGQTFIITEATLDGDVAVKGGAGNNVSIKLFGAEAQELVK